MRPVCNNYEAQNEYTRPLSGNPYYRNSGIIYALDKKMQKYAIGKIDFERYDEQNFQYVFYPEWGVIDTLPASVFQGIPGLDMSLRLERYYRVNITPYFITERTPGEGREDLWELLDEVGLDYYDRFEWLLRTDMHCGIDNLIVERASVARNLNIEASKELPDDLQPDDCVLIPSFESISSSNKKMRQCLIKVLRSGAQIRDEQEDRLLSKEECNILLRMLMAQDALDNRVYKESQSHGIQKAKEAGKYAGRKKIMLDSNLMTNVFCDFKQRRITESEAMQRIGVTSRSTFYRRLKEFEANNITKQ